MTTASLIKEFARYYEPPQVEAVEKTLRKERKKLRQSVHTLEKLAADALDALSKATLKAASLEEARQKVEQAHRSSALKKGAKHSKQADDLASATKFAEDAKKTAALKEAEAAKASHAVQNAKLTEDRPHLLIRLEGAWFGAVTEVWGQVALQSGGEPTEAHMQAWARDASVRQKVEKAYTELVHDKAFLDK